jgi:hypothetical protein
MQRCELKPFAHWTPFSGNLVLRESHLQPVELGTRVEVMGRWSNLSHQGKCLQALVDMVPSGPIEPKSRTPKAIHRRLTKVQTSALLADYEQGMKMRDLATRYRIHKHTVTKLTQRAGARPRYPALLPEELAQAAKLYKSGQSLAVVGDQFGVNPTTVRTALVEMGIAMRGIAMGESDELEGAGRRSRSPLGGCRARSRP